MGPANRSDDQLGDAITGNDGHGFLPVVDDDDPDLPAIVGVDGAGSVDESDPLPESKSGARPHLPFIARRDFKEQTGRDPLDLARRDVDGLGIRGVEGKIAAAKYARENKIPYFGICLGMQCAVIEAARNLAGITDANSSEFNQQTPDPVIYLIEQWYDYRTKSVQKRDMAGDKGGSMRLGAYPCKIEKGTHAYQAYGTDEISERHRHRYEFNNRYKDALKKAGLVISGLSPDGELVEIVELKNQPWFLGCQFHPEFKSAPRKPHPLFTAFINAALKQKERVKKP